MLLNILRKDVQKNKSITAALFVFMMLSSLLVSSGTTMFTKLFYSIDYFFQQASAPHFVQMHAGELNQAQINNWSHSHPLVHKQQTVEMVSIDGQHVFLGDSTKPELNSVMDISFVKQNESFDFLLDLDNQLVHVQRGEIGVPIFYMQRDKLNIGDQVIISRGSFQLQLTISHFVRDALMNPSIVHSKRFVVHEADFESLKHLGMLEYLIEFQLTDLHNLPAFQQAYAASALPKQGPTVDYYSFKVLNALTDGIVALIIMLVSMLLMIIALLCLRFSILATLEEDYREIGIMKAIGIDLVYIRRTYLAKYILLAAMAAGVGFLASIWVGRIFADNMTLYIGMGPENVRYYLISFVANSMMLISVLFFCHFTFRRFKHITVVEALRVGSMGQRLSKPYFALSNRKYIHVNLFYALRDVFSRLKMYSLLMFIFIICSFIIVVPINFLNTLQSPAFITYLGIGQSDLRIDIQPTNQVGKRIKEIMNQLKVDPDVERLSLMVTSTYRVAESDGTWRNIQVETGDFTFFPIAYLEGKAPRSKEIALSYLSGKELEKGVGDSLRVDIAGQEQELMVSGLYQDITNGGRTAKALLPIHQERVLWYVINVDVKPNLTISEKAAAYMQSFYPAKVTHLEDYVDQTLGDTKRQIKLLTGLAILLAISLATLMTNLIVNMSLAKDSAQIAIMKNLGFSLTDIRLQCMIRVWLVLGTGIMIGIILANTLGEHMVSFLWSFLGASKISFVIHPVQTYLLCPLILMISVTLSAGLSIMSIKTSNIARMNSQ